MALICILIGIILERTTRSLEQWRQFHWYDHYSKWMTRRVPGLTSWGASSIVVLLLPVLLLVQLLDYSVEDTLFGLFSFLYSLAVLIYTLGPTDLDWEVDQYLTAREQGDEETANHMATRIMGKPASESPDQQIADVMHAILAQANNRLFAVIFWFVFLGPLGAMLYRLAWYTMTSSNHPTIAAAAGKLEAILAWAPAHLVAAGYALTGNYEGASQGFREKVKQENLNDCNTLTLVSAGLGALKDCAPGEETACIRATRGLVLRTLVVWLAVIAGLTLIGWTA